MSKPRKYDATPMVMWCGLFAGIAVLAYTRPYRIEDLWRHSTINWDEVVACLYLIWMVFEFRVSKKDVRTEGKRISDAATCQFYGLGQALTVLTALWYPSIWKTPQVAHPAGICIFVLGGCYRLWAIRTLGRFYSHRVQFLSRHQIVREGPYRFSRHPAYAGMIVANCGLSLFFFNWVTICVFLLVLVPAIMIRIVVEEKMLFQIDGYAEFAEKRKRLFPSMW